MSSMAKFDREKAEGVKRSRIISITQPQLTATEKEDSGDMLADPAGILTAEEVLDSKALDTVFSDPMEASNEQGSELPPQVQGLPGEVADGIVETESGLLDESVLEEIALEADAQPTRVNIC